MSRTKRERAFLMDMFGGGAALPTELSDDFASDSGAWLDGALAGAAMTISTGRGIWTPTDEADLVVNGTMEADANWSNSGSVTSNARSDEQKHGGTYSRKIVAGGAFGGARSDLLTTITRRWYRFSGWMYGTTSSLLYLVRRGDGGAAIITVSRAADSTWLQTIRVYRETAGGASGYVYGQINPAATFYMDDFSLVPLADASVYRLQRIGYPSSVTAKVRRTVGVVAGVVLYKNATNYVMAYIDVGDNVRLVKCVDGTAAQVGTAAIIYAAGSVLTLTPSADFDAFTVTYKSVGVISDAAITDFAADAVNDHFTTAWYAGLFHTYNSGDIDADGFDDFAASAVNFT